MLGSVWCRRFADDSFVCEEGIEFSSHEFTTTIQSEEADLEARLRFHFSDEMFEVAKGLVLGLKREAPHVCGLVTCEGDGKTVAIDRGGLDRTDEVTVDPFDGKLRLLGAVLRGVVGSSLGLASQAARTGLGVQRSGIEFDAENGRVRSSGFTGCLQRLVVHMSHPFVPEVGGQSGFGGVASGTMKYTFLLLFSTFS